MGRFNGGSQGKDRSRFGFWIMVYTVYLFMFLVILPPIMSCTGICDSIDPNSLLILWFDIWTLFGAITWVQMTFGVFAGLLIFGMLDMMD